jgi:nitric oxide dioxygenase
MLSQQTIEIVQSTIPLLAENGEAITHHFYGNLLTDNPGLKNVFNPTNQQDGAQARALADAVFAYANNLENLEALLPAVARIAHKHVSLGVKPEQYPIIGGALLSAIQEVAELPDNHPALTAWGEAYGVLADVFIKAEEELYQQNEQQTGGWRGFRDFAISEVKRETGNVKSFYLTPMDGGPVPAFKDGQYVGLKTALKDQTFTQIRQYSLSGPSNLETLRITTKAEPEGLVSNYLHQCEEGTTVSIQAPTGVFNLDNSVENHIFIAGGVGITPLVGMLYEALNKGIEANKILFIQAQNSPDDEIFKSELAHLQAKHGFNYMTQFSGHDEKNYVDVSKLKAACDEVGIKPENNTAVYFCGPKPFMSAMKQCCLTLGTTEQHIHYETFGPTTAL